MDEARKGLAALADDPALRSAHALRMSRLCGHEHDAIGQVRLAVREADAWTDASPEPLLAHVQAMLPLRDDPDMRSAFERLAERLPDHPAVLFGRGRLLQGDGRRSEALALIERALSAAPGVWPYHRARLKLLLTERPVDVDAALARIAELWPDGAQRYVATAEVHLARGELDEAIETADAVQPPTPASLRLHALGLAAQGRLKDALAATDELATHDPLQGHTVRTRVLTDAGRLEGALAALRDQIMLAPDPVAPRVQEARLLGRLGRTDEAERRLRALVAERPAAFAPRIALVDRLTADGRLEEALLLLLGPAMAAPSPSSPSTADPSPTSPLLPSLPRTREMRARLWPLLARHGRLDELREDVERAAHDSLPPAREIVRATHALQDRADELAVVLLERAVEGERVPDPAIMGRLLMLVSAHVPTEKIEERITALGPNLPPAIAHRVRAQAFDRAGEAEAALDALRRVPTAERREGDVAMIGRLLNDRHHRTLALRYLAVHARAWPGLGRTIATLHARQGNDAAAWERFAALDGALPAPARRQLELSLAVQTGRGGADAALLEEAERSGFAGGLQPILRQALAWGDVGLTNEARDRFLDRRRTQRSHWSVSLPGQLLCDLRIAEATLGADGLRALRASSLADLARAVIAHPRLYAPAAVLIGRIGPSGRREKGAGDTSDAGRENQTGGSPRDGNGMDRLAIGSPFAPPPSVPSLPVPLRVYQYWNDDPPPEAVAALVGTWRRAPGVEHSFLHRRSALEWLRAVGEDWVRAFRMANNPAEEADFLRLVVLWRMGGVWADADDRLLGNIERLTDGGGLTVFQEPMGNAIGNNVLTSSPGHVVLGYAATTARDDLLGRSNESTWQKTGPGLLTRAVAQFAARSILRTGALPTDVTIHPQSVLRREVGIHTRLPHKADATYWNARRQADPGYGMLLDRTIERWATSMGPTTAV